MKKAREARKTYESVLAAIERGDWAEAEARFRAFTTLYGVPRWYEDEVVYQGMRLWQEERVRDVVRHFALVLDRVAGRAVCWDPDDGLRIEEALRGAA